MDYERERLIQDFVADCSQRPEELNRAVDKLQKELETLAELLKAKELEWNTLLRLKKLKEETLERLKRKKRQTAFDETSSERFLDHATLRNALKPHGNNQLMMVPIVSSSPTSMLNRAPPPIRMPDYSSHQKAQQQRPILPKPYGNVVDPSTIMREGRNGPVLDVKSIIADYRYSIQCVSRLVRAAIASSDARGDSSGSYKDVLAQFAKLTGGANNQANLASAAGNAANMNPSSKNSHPPSGLPPPPYPEVTLHPVGGGGRIPSPPVSTSLLHGILTKNVPTSRPSNFSPTLARLLTAPDRPPAAAHQSMVVHPPPPPYRPQQQSSSSRVPTISDIINSSKTRGRCGKPGTSPGAGKSWSVLATWAEARRSMDHP
ncbi:unnamed protein product [Nesidiocoris tenuis]|uniref:Uncharacterized protein n=1 Tax=Nesidiocoris tenuis TaxID=355587 RepID=A0A6H5G3N6_9HEMI|nr:unnamed protein product [Nesidiocoris tenuis]